MKRTFLLLLMCSILALGSRSATPILGTPVATPERMYQYGLSKGAGKNYSGTFTLELCKLYYDIGKQWGVRGDIALCQSFWETGWFNFTGGTAMRPWHHNYCGLGVGSLGAVGCTFADDYTGVTVQLQHLWSYATTRDLPSGWTNIDPRWAHGYRGKAPNWEDLGSGKWASAAGYGSKIMATYNEMMAFQMANPKLTASTTSVTLSAEQGASAPSANVTIKGENLSSAIIYNSSTSAVKVSTSNWDEFTGGTLTITLDTSKSPGTYTGYVAVQSGSGDSKQRIQIQVSATVTAKAESTITVSPSSLTFTATQGQSVATQAVKVSAKDLSADMTYGTNSSMFTVTPAADWNARTGGTLNVSVNTDRAPGTYQGYMYVQTSMSLRQQVAVTAVINAGTGGDDKPIPALDFVQIWNKSQTAGNADIATSIRNFDYMDGKLYCIYNTGEIVILDARTGDRLGSLANGDVVSGGTLRLCDVKCHDGRIYACNLKGNASTQLRVYCWDNDSAQPTLLMATDDTQGVERVGDCLHVTGSHDNDLWLAFGRHENSATSIIEFNRKNNTWTSKKVNATASGSNIAAGASVRVKPTGTGYWIVGGSLLPTYLGLDGAKQYALSTETVLSGNDFDTFTYDSRQYAMVATYLNKASSSLSDGIMRLYDITGGWDKAVSMGDYPSAGLGTTRNTAFSGGVVTRAYTRAAEAWVLTCGQGLAYFRSGSLSDITGGSGDDDDDTPSTLPDKFTTDWEYSNSSRTITADYMDLTTSVMTRNMALFGDNLYIVKRTSSDADVVIADAMTGLGKGTLSTDGIGSGTWRFASVAALDDAVIATNLATSVSGTINVYAWTGPDAAPRLILSTTDHGARAGDLISASGSLADGKIYLASNTGYAGKVFVYTITNGTASPTPHVITLKDESGNDYDIGGAFAVIDIKANADGTFYASGKGKHAALFGADGTMIKTFGTEATHNQVCSSSFHPVTYGQYTLGAITSYGANSIERGYLNLINITDGVDKATVLHRYPELDQSGNRNTTFVTTAIARRRGRNLDMWVMVPSQGIAKYTASQTSSAVEDIAPAIDEPRLIMTQGTVSVQGAECTAITAYTLTGMAVATAAESIDVSTLNPGMYIFVARLSNGNVLSAKAIVR